MVAVKVDKIICQALSDTGAGSSYASRAQLRRLKKRPVRKEHKRIEMMMQSTSIGEPGEAVAELTKFGCTLRSPEYEDDLINTLLTKSSAED